MLAYVMFQKYFCISDTVSQRRENMEIIRYKGARPIGNLATISPLNREVVSFSSVVV